MTSPATDIARRLADNAEAVCRRYLSNGRLRIIAKDTTGKEVFRRTLSGPETQQTIGFGLVGANQTRRMALPIELPVDGGNVDVSFTPDS